MKDSESSPQQRGRGANTPHKPIESSARTAVAMRHRAATLKSEGFVQSAIWFEPGTIRILNETQKKLGISSRSETVNRLIEFLAADKDLFQEFLAVTT